MKHFLWDVVLCPRASSSTHLNALQWDVVLCPWASSSAHLNAQQWDVVLCLCASSSAHLNALQWDVVLCLCASSSAHFNALQLDVVPCLCASSSAHLNALQWDVVLCLCASSSAHLNALQWDVVLCLCASRSPHFNALQSLRMSELFTQWHGVTAQMAHIFSNSIVRSSNLRSCKTQIQMKNTTEDVETYLGLSYWRTCSNKCRARNKQIHDVTQQKPTDTWCNPTKTNKYIM